MYDTCSQVADREREGIAKKVSRFAIVVALTLSVTPAQRYWPKTTEDYAVIPVQYHTIILWPS